MQEIKLLIQMYFYGLILAIYMFNIQTFPRTLHLQVFLESRDILNQLDRFLRELIWPGIKHSTLWETLLKTFDDPWCGITLQTKVYGCVWTAGGGGVPVQRLSKVEPEYHVGN